MLTNILTALAVVVNGIPQGLLALSFGFAAFPTAIAFIIGIAGSLAFNSVATISFQAETITLAGTMGRNVRERLSLVFWGAAFLFIPSVFGLNEAIVAFIGPTIVTSMMAGVGIMLAYVAIELFNAERWSGTASMISGLAVWLVTKDLAWTIIISVLVSTAVYNYLRVSKKVAIEETKIDLSRERFNFGDIEWRFWKNPRIFVGALALACLNIGANISFGKITGSIAGAETNIDHLAIYSSLADMGSSLFGGGPVEAIISGTATAPKPILASVLMMGIMAVILLMKLLPIIGQYVHRSSIAGFLFILGTFVTFATNIQGAIASAPEFAGPYGFGPWGMVIGATTLVSARWNPFFGLLAGLAIKFYFGV
ncbi:NCS2 family permease [Aminobacterium sp. EBM-42]|jgi:AGZA family xanthine/uracil permease-like MFS transporter|uniref:NCS2 family permease n=1 Tax=Aminobacterium TaxID=81466 RepID=UPI000A56C1D8|nr:NCS2 family permease [Aminobacterium sp. EBM-42]